MPPGRHLGVRGCFRRGRPRPERHRQHGQGRHADRLRRQRRRPARFPLRRRHRPAGAEHAARASSRRRISGIAYKPGKVGPVFGDFDNDGRPRPVRAAEGRLQAVPQRRQGPLHRRDGEGRAWIKFTGRATSAAWGDVDNDGHLDLVVGCLRGPNRFFRNKGDGTFEDATEAIGLNQQHLQHAGGRAWSTSTTTACSTWSSTTRARNRACCWATRSWRPSGRR